MKKLSKKTKRKSNKPAMSLVLRCCGPDGTSHGGFKWPTEVGKLVTAPDWNTDNACGNGLHGWLNGVGDYSSSSYATVPGAIWMVLEVETKGIINLGGKVKFQSAKILLVGSKAEASAYIISNSNASPEEIIGASLIVGDKKHVHVADLGTATAGYRGTATAGDCGTATAGYKGTATAGDEGTATAGNYGTVAAGDCGTATAGNSGTATAGYKGTATAGDGGTVAAGDEGQIRIAYYNTRYRLKCGYIGEDGLKPNVKYRLNDKFEFEEVKNER